VFSSAQPLGYLGIEAKSDDFIDRADVNVALVKGDSEGWREVIGKNLA